MFNKENKRLLESAKRTIVVLSRLHNEGCKKGNIDSETLDAIASGCEILEAKKDEMEDEYLEDLAYDLSWHVHDAIEKIELAYLHDLGGTQIPEGYGNRTRLDNAEEDLSKALAKLLLEEMFYG